ncbi:MAG: DNA repair protein RecO [Pseudomonadota bacterium]
MEFADEGVLLAAHAHGENHAVAEVFTARRGRWAGLVYGGQGARKKPVLQAGNGLLVQWKGRVSDSLGHFDLELANPRAAQFMHDRLSLAGLSALCATAAAALPERESHPSVYDAMGVVLDHLDDHDLWPTLLARWEAGLLAACGFGLTLDRCAATGADADLTYVSPKSAQAVSAEAGEPYKDRLLPLPAFLHGGESLGTRAEALDGLKTTGHFIETRLLAPAHQPLPEARRRLAEVLAQDAS